VPGSSGSSFFGQKGNREPVPKICPRSQIPFGNAFSETPFREDHPINVSFTARNRLLINRFLAYFIMMPRSRYRFFETEYPYFLTCTVVGWLPVFTRPETVNVLFESWRYLVTHTELN
jgi:hypothetical protein